MSTLKITVGELQIPVKITGLDMQTRMDPLVYQKMMHFVDKAQSDEVSGLGLLTMTGNTFHVHDVFLLPQKNGGATTDIEPEDFGRLMYQTREQQDQGQLLRFWWHSHVRMSAFWSGTDRETMKLLARGGWFLSLVVNQKREHRCAFQSHDPELFLDEIPFTVAANTNRDTVALWDEEYEKNVKKKIYALPPGPKGKWWEKKETSGKNSGGKNRRKERKKARNGGGTRVEYDPDSGLQAYTKYVFLHPTYKTEVIAFLSPDQIKAKKALLWYRDSTKYKVSEEFTLQKIAEEAKRYVAAYLTDHETKIIWTSREDLSEAQVELLDDWKEYRFVDEISDDEWEAWRQHEMELDAQERAEIQRAYGYGQHAYGDAAGGRE